MTDALSFIEARIQRKRWAFLFGLIFLFPILGNVMSRLTRSRGWWLNDFDALVCGAHFVAHGLSPYSLHPVFQGLRPAPFVYAPQIGAFFATPVEFFGLSGARLAYLLILLPAMALLTWYALIKTMPKAPFPLRLMTLAAINGSAFACGNIAFVLHGMVVGTALLVRRTRVPFIAAVIVAALVKPVFLTYLVVLIYDERPLFDRLRAGAVAAGLGLAAVAWLMLNPVPFAQAWHDTLNAVVIQQQPGIGFFGDISLLGVPATSVLAQAGYVLFAAIVMLAGFVIAERGALGHDERIALGLGVAQLLNPRLMDYDLIVLAPAVAIIVMAARPLGPRTFAWVTWIFAGMLSVCVGANMAGINVVRRAPLAVFVYCGLLIYVAVRTRRAAAPAQPQAVPVRSAPR